MRNLMRSLAIAIVMLVSAGAARADQSYLLTLSGNGVHPFDAGECPLPSQVCNPPVLIFDWEGIVTVVVDSDAPGTFTGDHFVSLAFAPTQGLITAFSGNSFLSAASVTVAGGHVTSLDAQWAGSPPAAVTFSGLSVSYEQPPTQHFGSISARATLVPVPEASTVLLLLGGLAAMGLRRWRSRPRRHGWA